MTIGGRKAMSGTSAMASTRKSREEPMEQKNDPNKEFQIVSVCRADLESVGLSKQQVDRLTDDEMTELAGMMSDLYSENGYWEDLERCLSRILAEKGVLL